MVESEDMIDVCDDLGIESFFEHVLNRTEELLDENSNVSGEHRIYFNPFRSPREIGKITSSIGEDSHRRN